MKTAFSRPLWTCAFALTLLFFFTSITLTSAQTITWDYAITTDTPNQPGNTFITPEGLINTNILTEDTNKPGHFTQLTCLSQINIEGAETGRIELNSGSINTLMPISESVFVSNKLNWGISKEQANETQIFETKGSADAAFKSSLTAYTTAVQSEEAITFFKNASDFNAYTFAWGSVNEDLEFVSHNLSLENIKKEGLGITNNNIDPIQLQNGTWVIPVQYGEIKGSALSIDHGSLIGMRDNQLIWNFPKHLDEYNVQGICSFKNKIGLLERPSHCGDHHIFITLDAMGNKISSIRIEREDILKHVFMNDTQLIIATNKDLFFYDFKGNHQSTLSHVDMNIEKIRSIKMFDENNLIVVGHNSCQTSVLSIQLNTEVSNVINEELKEEISETTANENKSINHVAYPNPAAEYINFKIENFNTERLIELLVYDMRGQLMFSKQLTKEITTVDLINYNSGQYIYNLIETKDNNDNIKTGKFIKVTR